MSTEIKSRPILFNGEMVRAILDGRKTMTRRVVSQKTLQLLEAAFQLGECRPLDGEENDWDYISELCPFGQVGDRLWVRETFGEFIDYENVNGQAFELGRDWVYRADGENVKISTAWKPSIHMPRSACRIELEITDIRIERLNDISEEDAKAEGAQPIDFGYGDCYKLGFNKIWDSINGKESWSVNPWVWCINFRSVSE